MLPFTKQELENMIKQKYVSVQKHPEYDLFIYNYSQNAQFENLWNSVTINCRGLILNKDYEIIAHPFKKFWNYEEHIEKSSLQGQIPIDEKFDVFEKMDGSLGICFYYKDKWHIATRGSFTSEQAKKGEEILYNKYDVSKLIKGITYCFEIIY